MLEKQILSGPWQDTPEQRDAAAKYLEELRKGVTNGTVDEAWIKDRYEKVTGFRWPTPIDPGGLPPGPGQEPGGDIDPPEKPPHKPGPDDFDPRDKKPGDFSSHKDYLENYNKIQPPPWQGPMSKDAWNKEHGYKVLQPAGPGNKRDDDIVIGQDVYGGQRKVGKDNRPIPKKPRHVV